jgi:uncharacterized protein YndB with AHSA1/START domain
MSEPAFTWEADLAAPPERVFAALTDGALTRRYWFDRRIESTWVVGEPVRFYDGPSDRVTDVGEVLAYEPARRVSYTFKYLDGNDAPDEFTRVTFDLAATADGTRLRLVHDRLARPDDVEGWRRGWTPILDGLRAFVARG